ncbi:hypothetical protein K474DRAFT_1663456 [Panus rudis PR-1116 ss-1]|nr:hypothetical protein K474DRAFT_1663456 [Panus rudis PR-1116 ss-1]
MDETGRRCATFPESVPKTPRPRAVKRWSSPAGFPSHAHHRSPSTSTIDSSSTLVNSARRFMPELPQIESGDGSDSPMSAASTLADDASPPVSCRNSPSTSRKKSLVAKVQGIRMFKGKKKNKDDDPKGEDVLSSGSSTPFSMSPSPATAPLELPDVDDTPKGESSKTIFPGFKFRPKRASASATMSTSYSTGEDPLSSGIQRSKTHLDLASIAGISPDTPSASPSGRSNKKRFSSYLNLNIGLQSPILSPTTSSLPHDENSESPARPSTAKRLSFGSAFSPLTPLTRRGSKTPGTPATMPRTQPYGAPYFAPMPTGERALPMRRKSTTGGASVLGVKDEDSGIRENELPSIPATPTATNLLGLSFDTYEVPRSRKGPLLGHRRLASDSLVPS